MEKLKLQSTYTNLSSEFYSIVDPERASQPTSVVFNKKLAEELGFPFSDEESSEWTSYFSGNKKFEDSQCIAQAYAGHQFGHFTILGDGRAHLLGEYLDPQNKRYDIQLKGSGRTPYSRGGDGKASLGPMLREYIISEAMHALKIPTSRSLAVILTGDPVYREKELEGAVLTRISSSHIRVGTFQYAALEGKVKELADYTISRHYPECFEKENPYLYLLERVLKKQTELIINWMRVGFIHGVMNTDNMTVSGETIDYGPCAFMDNYNPERVFSSIDVHGRYSFQNQPEIALWNLSRFAETLLSLIDSELERAKEKAEKVLSTFHQLFSEAWYSMMFQKIGLPRVEEESKYLVHELMIFLEDESFDYTQLFYSLGDEERLKTLRFLDHQQFSNWYKKWKNQIPHMEESVELMRSVNPIVIPRNHLVEKALQNAVEKKDYSSLHELIHAVQSPYDKGFVGSAYSQPPDKANPNYKTFCGT